MTPKTVTRPQTSFGIKDTNPETRTLFAWYTNKNGVTPHISHDIQNIFKEGGDAYQLQQRIWTYTLEKLILETQKRLEVYAQEANNDEEKKEIEIDYIVTELFERALRNISYNVLAQALNDFYRK